MQFSSPANPQDVFSSTGIATCLCACCTVALSIPKSDISTSSLPPSGTVLRFGQLCATLLLCSSHGGRAVQVHMINESVSMLIFVDFTWLPAGCNTKRIVKLSFLQNHQQLRGDYFYPSPRLYNLPNSVANPVSFALIT